LHNLQKSLVLLTFGFLPLLALLVGVCMCSLLAFACVLCTRNHLTLVRVRFGLYCF
jgi:hypothetical protein